MPPTASAKVTISTESELSGTGPPATNRLYITGPWGIGKTYLIYGLVHCLRALPNYRVVYVSDCEEWTMLFSSMQATSVLLDEIRAAFGREHDDNELGIAKWVEDIRGVVPGAEEGRKDLFALFLNHLTEWCKARKIELVFVFDQANSIYERNHQYSFPWSLVETLASPHSQVKVIVVASANNEGFPKGLRRFALFRIVPQQVSTDEVDKFLTWQQVALSPDQVEQVAYWTGGFFLELYEFLNVYQKLRTPNTAPSFTTVLRDFVRKRLSYYTKRHTEFKSKGDLMAIQRAISYMLLAVPMVERPNQYDRRFMLVYKCGVTLTSGDTTRYTVRAIHGIARTALLACYYAPLDTVLDLTCHEILSSTEYTADTKGRVVEHYFISVLEWKRSFHLKMIRAITTSDTLTASGYIQFVEHFGGQRVPFVDSSKLANGGNVLYVPDVMNYPEVDCLLYVGREKMLLAMQLTVRDLASHILDSATFEKKKADWAHRLNIEATSVHLVFIVPDARIDEFKKRDKTLYDQYCIRFSDLAAHFPRLGDYVPQ
ncbi:hypothetical protein DFJ77DRAFT_477665 [Powellomyces hirtus]|nr:hypothetical protein DFJ77DRAFT_477665 [Powellomyces hirtus]